MRSFSLKSGWATVGLVLVLILGWAALARAENLKATLFNSGDASLGLAQTISLSGSSQIASTQKLGEKPKTRGAAMLRSLLIPGWGESYLGYHRTARVFFWTDVALWATVISLEVYSRWKEDQFLSFGATHADAQMSGKTDRFYADIGNYMSTEDYNEAKLRQRAFDDLYTDPAYSWAWDSDQNRAEYDDIRIQSRSAHNKIFFFIGAAALNRLISAIDTCKKAADMLKTQKTVRLGMRLEPQRDNESNGLRLVMEARF